MKKIELTPGISFTANNKVYTPTTEVTIGRFSVLQALEQEALQLSDSITCHEVMIKAMNEINSYKPGEAYTTLYNKIESDQRNVKLQHYVLRVCAVYINGAGEDDRYLTEEMIGQKINDWAEEGLDVVPFLVFGVSACRELLQRYKTPILHILEEAEEIKTALNSVMDIKTLTPDIGPEA